MDLTDRVLFRVLRQKQVAAGAAMLESARSKKWAERPTWNSG
jgi:hypothetical protein